MIKYILIGMITACSYNPFAKNEPNDTGSPMRDQLIKKYNVYKGLYGTRLDKYNMIAGPGKTGDSLLFSCLGEYATGIRVDLESTITPEGRPLRHPEISPEISKTPISRDMVIGLMFCLINRPSSEALPILEKLISFGRSNFWDLCGDAEEYNISAGYRLGRCQMNDAVLSTIFEMAKLKGFDCDAGCKTITSIDITNILSGENKEAYVRHLYSIHVYIRAKIMGFARTVAVKSVESHFEKEYNNGIYGAVSAKYGSVHPDKVYHLLLNEDYFPNKRLPTSEEFCTHYLYQRDQFGVDYKDWVPCTEGTEYEVYDGVDFLLASKIILE